MAGVELKVGGQRAQANPQSSLLATADVATTASTNVIFLCKALLNAPG